MNIGDISVFLATIAQQQQQQQQQHAAAAAAAAATCMHAKVILAAVSNAPAILYIQHRTAARFYTRAHILCRKFSVVHGYTDSILH